MEKSQRLMSLDALRGFDMLFITGLASLISALCAAFGGADCWLATQMRHVPWEGFAHHDTIFPLFLFLAGVSWPFSLASQESRGRTPLQIHLKVAMRTIILFLFGLSFGGILGFKENFRMMSVLGFIGISWGIAAVIFMHVRKTALRVGIIVAILFGYWALLRFGMAPGAPVGADSYSKEWNIIAYFDRMAWPNHLYQPGVYDPESAFTCVGGVAMALMGMCTGSLLGAKGIEAGRKAALLFGVSVVLLLVDLVFVHLLGDKIVKALWSPSFVLSAAVYSTAMMALFYWLIDVKGWRGWTFYFRVVGMNSITIYVLQMIGIVATLHGFLFSGLVGWVGEPWGQVVRYATYCGVVWMILWFFYRRNIFLKV